MTGQGKSAIDTLFAESFKELAKKHPIEKITIKEITDLAGVIRPTFYNHFQDKYELLEWIIRTELLEPVKPLFLRKYKQFKVLVPANTSVAACTQDASAPDESTTAKRPLATGENCPL